MEGNVFVTTAGAGAGAGAAVSTGLRGLKLLFLPTYTSS